MFLSPKPDGAWHITGTIPGIYIAWDDHHALLPRKDGEETGETGLGEGCSRGEGGVSAGGCSEGAAAVVTGAHVTGIFQPFVVLRGLTTPAL